MADFEPRLVEDERLVVRDLLEHAHHVIEVAVVRDAKLDPDPAHVRRHAVVDDQRGDEAGVRDDHRDALARDHVRGAQPDVLDRTEYAADIDEVALLDRALEQEEEARDEVLGELLEPEADADQQHRATGHQCAGVDADRPERHEDGDQHDRVARDLDGRVAHALIEVACGQETLQAAADERCHDPGDEQDRHRGEQGQRSDGSAREDHQRGSQVVEDRIEHEVTLL